MSIADISVFLKRVIDTMPKETYVLFLLLKKTPTIKRRSLFYEIITNLLDQKGDKMCSSDNLVHL